MDRTSVVLPAPLGPSSASHSPRRNSRLALSSALFGPKLFTAFVTVSTRSNSPPDSCGKFRTDVGACIELFGDRRDFMDELRLLPTNCSLFVGDATRAGAFHETDVF